MRGLQGLGGGPQGCRDGTEAASCVTGTLSLLPPRLLESFRTLRSGPLWLLWPQLSPTLPFLPRLQHPRSGQVKFSHLKSIETAHMGSGTFLREMHLPCGGMARVTKSLPKLMLCSAATQTFRHLSPTAGPCLR